MPASMQDVEALHRALDEAPADRHLRLVLADAVEERGDVLAAECLRWLAREGKRPMFPREDGSVPSWTWTRLGGTYRFGHPAPDYCTLPEDLLYHVGPCRKGFHQDGYWRFYERRREAEEALIEAWKQLPEAVRLGLLAQPGAKPG